MKSWKQKREKRSIPTTQDRISFRHNKMIVLAIKIIKTRNRGEAKRAWEKMKSIALKTHRDLGIKGDPEKLIMDEKGISPIFKMALRKHNLLKGDYDNE